MTKTKQFELGIEIHSAQRMARAVVMESTSNLFLCNIAIDAMDVLLSSPVGRERLRKALLRQGFELHELPEKPARGKPTSSFAANPTKKPKTGLKRRGKPLLHGDTVQALAEHVEPPRAQQRKAWREVSVTVPHILKLCESYSLTDDILMKKFEVTEDELVMMRSNDFGILSPRGMCELLHDLRLDVLKPSSLPETAITPSGIMVELIMLKINFDQELEYLPQEVVHLKPAILSRYAHGADAEDLEKAYHLWKKALLGVQRPNMELHGENVNILHTRQVLGERLHLIFDTFKLPFAWLTERHSLKPELAKAIVDRNWAALDNETLATAVKFASRTVAKLTSEHVPQKTVMAEVANLIGVFPLDAYTTLQRQIGLLDAEVIEWIKDGDEEMFSHDSIVRIAQQYKEKLLILIDRGHVWV